MSAAPADTWFRKRLRAFAVLSCVLAGTVFWFSRPSPVQRLQPYLGQDLRALSEDEQIAFDGLVGALVPEARVFSRPTRPRTWDPRA
jgi:hypothetical protein